MLDSYSRMAEKNARELQREKERAEKLLLNIMPRAVFEEMKDFGSVSPQRFDDATILMLDFVDFTEMTVSQNPANWSPSSTTSSRHSTESWSSSAASG